MTEPNSLLKKRAGFISPDIINLSKRLRAVHGLSLIMLVALFLRLLLVADGAQRHFPDE